MLTNPLMHQKTQHVTNKSTEGKEGNEKLICTVSCCTGNVDKYKLDCSKYHIAIHVECSARLSTVPIYEKEVSIRHCEKCEKCVTESNNDISDEFIERSIENKIIKSNQATK